MADYTADIIRRAIPLAQRDARQKGLCVGQVVGHPKERIACTLMEIHGSRAVIGHGDLRRECSLDELFDPSVLKRISLQIHARIRGEKN